MTPKIIRENCYGLLAYNINDEMFRRREVEYVGEVTPESAYAVCRQLLQLAREDAEQEITLFINSPGGEVTSGMAVIDVMAAIPCPVRTVCLGRAYSMGACIFAAGNRREILPHGEVMIHEPLSAHVSGSAGSIDEISRRMLKTREVINSLLAQYTGKTLEEINEKTAKDSYFDAQEAVEFGLADQILDKFW